MAPSLMMLNLILGPSSHAFEVDAYHSMTSAEDVVKSTTLGGSAHFVGVVD